MRRSIAACVAAGVLVGLAGCSNTTPGGGTAGVGVSKAGTVAIVDLDEVARRLGRDLEMSESVQDEQLAVNKELEQLRQSLKKQYEAAVDKAGEEPSEEERKKLQTLSQQIDLKFNQERQKKTNELSAYRVTLISRFREEVRPIAQEVAADRGLALVVTKIDNLIFAYDPEAEITDAVVARLANSPSDRTGGAGPSRRATEEAVEGINGDEGAEEDPQVSSRPEDEESYQE
jgi:Skp family chaperone for outer membrane proteins